MTVKPDAVVSLAQDTMVQSLVAGGVFDKLVRLHIQTPSNEQAATIDWILPATKALVKKYHYT
jgi:hypothetical protein